VRRRILNLAAAISLVLFLATVTLWCRSYRVWDFIQHWRPIDPAASCRFTLVSEEGYVSLRYVSGPTVGRVVEDEYNKWRWSRATRRSEHYLAEERRLRFSYDHATPEQLAANMPYEYRLVITLPYWMPAAALIILPAVKLARIARHRRRLARGACLICGYDLRATPDRCPECGTDVKPQPAEGATT
jgi:hypothetical protein